MKIDKSHDLPDVEWLIYANEVLETFLKRILDTQRAFGMTESELSQYHIAKRHLFILNRPAIPRQYRLTYNEAEAKIIIGDTEMRYPTLNENYGEIMTDHFFWLMNQPKANMLDK